MTRPMNPKLEENREHLPRLKRAVRLSLPHDGLGFVRRACQSCCRIFKLKAGPPDGRLILQRVAERVRHGNLDETPPLESVRYCPYCRNTAREDAWLTHEQRGAIDQWSKAFSVELENVQRARLQLDPVTPPPAQNPERNLAPVRAFPTLVSGRNETNDPQFVTLVCCQREQKIVAGWGGPLRCHYCGSGLEEKARA